MYNVDQRPPPAGSDVGVEPPSSCSSIALSHDANIEHFDLATHISSQFISWRLGEALRPWSNGHVAQPLSADGELCPVVVYTKSCSANMITPLVCMVLHPCVFSPHLEGSHCFIERRERED